MNEINLLKDDVKLGGQNWDNIPENWFKFDGTIMSFLLDIYNKSIYNKCKV